MSLDSRILKNCQESNAMAGAWPEYGRAGTQRKKWSDIFIPDHLLASNDMSNLISFPNFKTVLSTFTFYLSHH